MSTSNTQIFTTFRLGQIVATPAALNAISEANQLPLEFIQRHARLEQGALSDDDHAENLLSAREGFRIFSSFYTNNQEKVWVITEADRSATTILMPSEY